MRVCVRTCAKYMCVCVCGCRFVSVSGVPAWAAANLNAQTVQGIVLATDVPIIGAWGFGDDTLTRIGKYEVCVCPRRHGPLDVLL